MDHEIKVRTLFFPTKYVISKGLSRLAIGQVSIQIFGQPTPPRVQFHHIYPYL